MESNVSEALKSAGSLDLMHDIVLPAEITFFPMASGWYLILALLLLWVLHKGFEFYAHYKKNLYRREALEALINIKNDAENEKAIHMLSLMKRVAIECFGREKVAALSDDSWWNFMESHSKVKVSNELRSYAKTLLYDVKVKKDSNATHALEEVVKVWIKTHRGETV